MTLNVIKIERLLLVVRRIYAAYILSLPSSCLIYLFALSPLGSMGESTMAEGSSTLDEFPVHERALYMLLWVWFLDFTVHSLT